MKKRWILWLTTLLAAVPLVQASLNSRIRSIFESIIEIGSLSFLGVPSGSMLIMFVRFLIGILVFTIIFAVMSTLGGAKKGGIPWMKRNIAVVVALVIALITMIFLPVDVLLAAGGGLGVAIGMILVGAPVVAIAMMIIKLPGQASGGDTRASLFLKLLLCCLLFWVLTAMSYHIGFV